MNLTGQMNIQQIEACLKIYDTWGNKHIINICSGQTDVISWGIGDFFALFLIAMLCAVSLIFVLLLLKLFMTLD